MSHENKITRELLDAVRAILITAALVVIFALSLILIASGMGYLLTLILPFTLFQATQLSAIMALFVLFLIHVFKKGMNERGYVLSKEGLDACIREEQAKERRRRRKKSPLYDVFDK